MEFQIEARRTWDIRNTRCRGCVVKDANSENQMLRTEFRNYFAPQVKKK